MRARCDGVLFCFQVVHTVGTIENFVFSIWLKLVSKDASCGNSYTVGVQYHPGGKYGDVLEFVSFPHFILPPLLGLPGFPEPLGGDHVPAPESGVKSQGSKFLTHI